MQRAIKQATCSNLLLYVVSIQNNAEFDGLSKQGITSVLLHYIVALTLYLSCCMRYWSQEEDGTLHTPFPDYAVIYP
jgi:hypothetical protein